MDDDMQAVTSTEEMEMPPIEVDWDDIPLGADLIPAGTYHVRLDSTTAGVQAGGKDPQAVDQPYFMCKWMIQEEPLVGRIYNDFVGYITPAKITEARNGDVAAREFRGKRLRGIRAIMEAAKYTPPKGPFKPEAFFSTNPEIKIKLNQKLDSDKVLQNNISFGGYLPLKAPIES